MILLNKKQLVSVILLLLLIFALPAVIFLVQKKQDIRPRALQGKANLHLSADTTNISVGQTFDVLVSLELTDPKIKVSGVDFVLLYDRSRLEVYTITPGWSRVSPEAAFTDAPIVNWGGSFPDNEESGFNYLRVSLVARKPTVYLKSGAVNLAIITFRAVGGGDAVIKFPQNKKYLEVVGITN